MGHIKVVVWFGERTEEKAAHGIGRNNVNKPSLHFSQKARVHSDIGHGTWLVYLPETEKRSLF